MQECEIYPVKMSFCGVHEGHLSVKLYHPTPRQEIISFLKNLSGMAIENTSLTAQIGYKSDESLKFHCTVTSINSKKNAVSFLLHTRKDFDILRGLYKFVGKAGFKLLFKRNYGLHSRSNNTGRNTSEYDNRHNEAPTSGNDPSNAGMADMERLKQEVFGLIEGVSKNSGKLKEDLLVELTTFTGRNGEIVAGKRDISLLSYKQLVVVRKKLASLLKAERG